MASLPKSLNFALSRFQSCSRDFIRITPNKTTYVDGETISFRLPQSGVIDLQSLAVMMNLTFRSGGTGGTFSFYGGQLIRRLEVLAGGASIGLAGCSDYGLAYMIRRRLMEPTYLNSISGSNNVYEIPSVTISSTAGANAPAVDCMIADFLGIAGGERGCRFLVLDAFPEIEIRVTLDVANRVPLPTAATFLQVNEVYMILSRYTFEDKLLHNLLASRLSQGPLEIPFTNVTTFQGPSGTGSISYPFSIAAQSIDYVAAAFRSATVTGATYYDLQAGGSGSTVQLTVNATPLSNWPLALRDAWWTTLEALDGHGLNVMVDPQVVSQTVWQNSRFTLLHRFCMPAADALEARHSLTGLSTYGSTVPFTFEGRSITNTVVPLIVVFHTSTLELSQGKLVNVIN
jgi:hypothetical protein